MIFLVGPTLYTTKVLANRGASGLIEPIPDFDSSVQLLGTVRGEEGATDVRVQHGRLVADKDIEGHDGRQDIIRQGGFAGKEAVELLKVDFRGLLDFEVERAGRATWGNTFRDLILGQDEL